MGLDIYAGTLTRYYSGNWKLITQQIAEQSGMSFSIMTPKGEYSPISNPEEITDIQNCIQEWQSFLLESTPDEYKENMWEENMEKEYFTDKPGWEAWTALAIFQYATFLNKPFPETICGNTMLECPLLKEGEENGIQSSLMKVQLWLPLEHSYMFSFIDPRSKEATLATISFLEDELNDLNNKTWKADESTILSWRNDEYYNPVKENNNFLKRLFQRKEEKKAPIYSTESLAKCAYSILYKAVKFAKEHKVPIVWDY